MKSILNKLIEEPGIIVIAFFVAVLAVMAYQFIKDATND